jgi:hypothetical protein
MGSSNSSVVEKCLEVAVGAWNIATPSTFAYQYLHVKPYNKDIPINPAAITYPSTSDQVAAIVKCAADNNLKVQARSGGHSYANYGMYYTTPQRIAPQFLTPDNRNRGR